MVKESQKVKEAEQKLDAALADTVPRRKVIFELSSEVFNLLFISHASSGQSRH